MTVPEICHRKSRYALFKRDEGVARGARSAPRPRHSPSVCPLHGMWIMVFVLGVFDLYTGVDGASSPSVNKLGRALPNQDPDAMLRDILVDYYNSLEKHKQLEQQYQKEILPDVSTDQGSEEEDYSEEREDSFPEGKESNKEGSPVNRVLDPALDPNSLVDVIWDYIKDHLQTRIWSGMFPFEKEHEGSFSERRKPNEEVVDKEHGYVSPNRGQNHRPPGYNADSWWEGKEHEENIREVENRKMVNRIFTASGFGLSVVVLGIFFISCTYCWCISSPSRMIGAVSTVLALILLFHRLHEFFLVFSVDDLTRVGKALVPSSS